MGGSISTTRQSARRTKRVAAATAIVAAGDSPSSNTINASPRTTGLVAPSSSLKPPTETTTNTTKIDIVVPIINDNSNDGDDGEVDDDDPCDQQSTKVSEGILITDNSNPNNIPISIEMNNANLLPSPISTKTQQKHLSNVVTVNDDQKEVSSRSPPSSLVKGHNIDHHPSSPIVSSSCNKSDPLSTSIDGGTKPKPRYVVSAGANVLANQISASSLQDLDALPLAPSNDEVSSTPLSTGADTGLLEAIKSLKDAADSNNNDFNKKDNASSATTLRDSEGVVTDSPRESSSMSETVINRKKLDVAEMTTTTPIETAGKAEKSNLEQLLSRYKVRVDEMSQRLVEAEDTVARLREELVALRKSNLSTPPSDSMGNCKDGFPSDLVAAAAESHPNSSKSKSSKSSSTSSASPPHHGSKIQNKPPLYPDHLIDHAVGPPPPPNLRNPNASNPHNSTTGGSNSSSNPFSLPPLPMHIGGASINAMLEGEMRKLRLQVMETNERCERRIAKLKQKAGKQKAASAIRIFELEQEVATLQKLTRPRSKPPSPIAPLSMDPSLSSSGNSAHASALSALQEQMDSKTQVILDLSVRVSELCNENATLREQLQAAGIDCAPLLE